VSDDRPAEPDALQPTAPRGGGLPPERTTRGALSQLIDVLLDKGVYLDLDLLVTVAEVPLIAVDLRATIAGVETMIEYGMLGPWDLPERRPSAVRDAPDADRVALRSDASYRETRAGSSIWREGILVIERSGALRWQGHGDRRASLRLGAGELRGISVRPGSGPGGGPVLEVLSADREVELAGADLERWVALLRPVTDDPRNDAGGGR
jgi:hypothetical protein